MITPFREVILQGGSDRLTATTRNGAWVVEGLSGWWGGVGVKGSRTARLGHGDFAVPNKRTGRSLTLNLIWTGGTVERDHVSRRLSGLFSDGEFGTVTATTGDLTLVSERVVLDGEVAVSEVGTAGVRAQIPLYAADPFLYGDEVSTFLRPIGSGVGLSYPLYGVEEGVTPVLSYGSAVDSQDPISNPGNAPAWPTFVVVGDFPSGFQIRVGDRVVLWPVPTAPQSPVRVEMSGSVWVGSDNQTHRAGMTQWSAVPPGETISPVFDPVQFGSGWCEVITRPTYL